VPPRARLASSASPSQAGQARSVPAEDASSSGATAAPHAEQKLARSAIRSKQTGHSVFSSRSRAVKSAPQ
jgi:hypothetical protein